MSVSVEQHQLILLPLPFQVEAKTTDIGIKQLLNRLVFLEGGIRSGVVGNDKNAFVIMSKDHILSCPTSASCEPKSKKKENIFYLFLIFHKK